jgi:hypothetical protein
MSRRALVFWHVSVRVLAFGKTASVHIFVEFDTRDEPFHSTHKRLRIEVERAQHRTGTTRYLRYPRLGDGPSVCYRHTPDVPSDRGDPISNEYNNFHFFQR